jgi:hypothetical protein
MSYRRPASHSSENHFSGKRADRPSGLFPSAPWLGNDRQECPQGPYVYTAIGDEAVVHMILDFMKTVDARVSA